MVVCDSSLVRDTEHVLLSVGSSAVCLCVQERCSLRECVPTTDCD